MARPPAVPASSCRRACYVVLPTPFSICYSIRNQEPDNALGTSPESRVSMVCGDYYILAARMLVFSSIML
ncbi:hypothetical protein EVAR_24634_1 [Eumeta japonica]|uniref:Uncharacterized protein n=1 Tax=Eumeta variegata TaxID=151549 RepID=A0A4C1V1R0_EUMVA|nr:hypothetical protein EVAR_24634_1 [Eumeta japonica]